MTLTTLLLIGLGMVSMIVNDRAEKEKRMDMVDKISEEVIKKIKSGN
ncbi:MAG: hypothetical protein SPI49_03535 [Eubacteriales bacterium]|nr:hypothetical protein [Eubacteriales bacterium]